MTIDTTEETYADTRQGRQAKAALAIAKMSEHQLPEIAHWMIRHDLSVSGSIRSYIDPFGALRLAAVFGALNITSASMAAGLLTVALFAGLVCAGLVAEQAARAEFAELD